MAIALQGRLSSLIYSGFLDFNESYHAGWNEATRYPEKYSTTYMHLDAYSVRAASVRTVDVEQLFEASNTYGPPFAKLSVRKLGDINVTTPSVEVRCAISTSDLNTPPGITISEIDDSSSRTPFVSVHLDEVNSMNSSATRYNISLQQSLFPLTSWTLQSTDHTWPGVTLGPFENGLYTSPYPTDRLLLQRLHSALQTTMSELETLSALAFPGIVNNTNPSLELIPSAYLRFLVSRARRMRTQQQNAAQSIDDDIPYIARLLAFWAQHMLTIAH
ncbi:hypothetical protein BU26DRAFT_557334 [Trematosphaeria pertusa]|uniref:Uncharacterized protein n=1 Tax=Trematosphaeria pertusa TaxID=390896 RepID=A0A6A6IZ26_9PLEO|nr:uncharacterized protein BU26DRAFT_557334 [Trematosphaeria pertusa]KAF2255831.1 hypothetical protein BU26DRAFT_557334 [Trematosphaeria pertusa]